MTRLSNSARLNSNRAATVREFEKHREPAHRGVSTEKHDARARDDDCFASAYPSSSEHALKKAALRESALPKAERQSTKRRLELSLPCSGEPIPALSV